SFPTRRSSDLVVIGGLLLATLLTLFVLPILYILFEKIPKLKLRTKRKTMKVLIVMLYMLSSLPAFSQQGILIDQAIDTAVKNSYLTKNSQLLSEYQQKLIKSSSDVPQASVNGEYGRLNSWRKDYKIGVSQTISFPTV